MKPNNQPKLPDISDDSFIVDPDFDDIDKPLELVYEDREHDDKD